MYTLQQYLRWVKNRRRGKVTIQAILSKEDYKTLVAEKNKRRMTWAEFLVFLWEKYKECIYTPKKGES